MAGFDKGTLAMAQIGLMGQARSQPDSRDSVWAIAPCQIPPLRLPTALLCRPCGPRVHRGRVASAARLFRVGPELVKGAYGVGFAADP